MSKIQGNCPLTCRKLKLLYLKLETTPLFEKDDANGMKGDEAKTVGTDTYTPTTAGESIENHVEVIHEELKNQMMKRSNLEMK